ncbi:DUF6344 domain-containing protein [Streptomyces sp. NPDC059008]|uniref:DUF6344 domain-containing protein n=1 Tax=Streptomyces sp. NPDC059008 TaxID=3346693 RepID=UPI00368C6419
MAATKVMKFWAVCLAMLGKLLASLGVSAAASAARRDAALYERTLGDANADSDAPGDETPKAVHRTEPDHDPGTGARKVPAAGAVPTVPGPRGVPVTGRSASSLRMFARPELPPTIKQRISAEAHGASPGLRSRCIRGMEPLPAATADAALQSDVDARSAVIPAARRHTPITRSI